MAVNKQNAHVRGKTGRAAKSKAPSQEFLDADRLIKDPAFKNALGKVEAGIVNLIVETSHDGSAEADAAEREMCRSLRTLKRLPRVMTKILNGETLRLADFRAHDPEQE